MNIDDVIQKAIAMGYASSHRGGRYRYPIQTGVPGEIVSSLSIEERDILASLKADDLSLEKIPRHQLELFIDSNMTRSEHYEIIVREAKIKFDKEFFKK